MKTVSYIIHGKVQGVAFRFFTQEKAKKLGVVGWVKNNANGSVQVLAQADKLIIEQFEMYLNTGPRSAIVNRIESQSQ